MVDIRVTTISIANYSTGRQSGIGRTNNSLSTPRTNTFGTPRTVNPNSNSPT